MMVPNQNSVLFCCKTSMWSCLSCTTCSHVSCNPTHVLEFNFNLVVFFSWDRVLEATFLWDVLRAWFSIACPFALHDQWLRFVLRPYSVCLWRLYTISGCCFPVVGPLTTCLTPRVVVGLVLLLASMVSLVTHLFSYYDCVSLSVCSFMPHITCRAHLAYLLLHFTTSGSSNFIASVVVRLH